VVSAKDGLKIFIVSWAPLRTFSSWPSTSIFMKSTRGSLLASTKLSIVLTLTDVPVPACVMTDEPAAVEICIFPSFCENELPAMGKTVKSAFIQRCMRASDNV